MNNTFIKHIKEEERRVEMRENIGLFKAKRKEIYKFLKKDYNYNIRIIEVKLILGKEVK
jgi:hypothetical protein